MLRLLRHLPLIMLLVCSKAPVGGNRPPTVIITRVVRELLDSDSARFEWQGSDRDGFVQGYLYWLNDSSRKCTTVASGVTLRQLSYGQHLFGVQAIDDEGAVSLPALAPFSVTYLGAIPEAGTDTTLEIITWNIQNFPKAGESTLARLRLLINRLNADLYCIQEIEDTLAFLRLVQSLRGYAGFYSRDNYGSYYQKTGILYRPDIVRFRDVRQIFWNNDSFPRPPLVAAVHVNANGQEFDFQLIVLHLKAGSDYTDRLRRAGACRQLKHYLDSVIGAGEISSIVVAGDWNDRLEVSLDSNVFRPFLEDSFDYFFLTKPLTGSRYHSSLVRGNVIFDHLLITRDMLPLYSGGRTVILRLDELISDYLDFISDHRPVMATFPLFRPVPKVGVEPTSPSLGGGF